MIRARAIAVGCFLSLTIGCYSYHTVRATDVSVGTAVRARLAPDEADRVGRILHRDDRMVEGELLDASHPDTLLLKVTTSPVSDAVAFGFTHQRISVGRSAVQELEVRRLDRVKTFAAVAGGAAALTYAALSAFGSKREPAQGPTRGGVDAARRPVPIVRWYLPLRLP